MNNSSIKKVLYASDLGKNSKIVFDTAINLATNLKADLTFIHVVNNFNTEQDEAIESYISVALFEQIKKSDIAIASDKINQRLSAVKSETPDLFSNVNMEVMVRKGRPTKQILKLAKEIDADLIILGSRTHSSMDELLLGSTASKVAKKSTVPVMIVPL